MCVYVCVCVCVSESEKTTINVVPPCRIAVCFESRCSKGRKEGGSAKLDLIQYFLLTVSHLYLSCGKTTRTNLMELSRSTCFDRFFLCVTLL